MAADAAEIIKRFNRLVNDEATYRQTCQDLAEFFTPYKANITTTSTPGARKTQRLFDTEGVVAARTFSANIQGALCNQAQEWYSLRIRDDELNRVKPVRDWCEAVTKIAVAAQAASNFYTELSEVFVDLPLFGRGGLYCDERPPTGPNRFGGLHYVATVIGHHVIGENAMGRVDTVFRDFEWPCAEVAKLWPDTCSAQVRTKAEDAAKRDDLVKLVHAVYPRDVSLVGARAAKGKAWASCYLEHESKTLLAEGGYDDNPYAVARWSKDSLSPYGWGLGAIAYPDVRTLNRYVELDLQARGKVVDPPLIQRQDAIFGSLSLDPAAINVSTYDGALKDSVMPLESGARFDVNNDGIARLERKIGSVFYGPLLREITKDLTATEAWMIQDEIMRLLGPAAGRLQTELLSAAIERTVAVLSRAGQLPPPPQELLEAGFDVDLDIVYEGPLARAQRSRDLVAIERKNGWLGGLATFAPEIAARAAQKFDWDGESSLVAEVVGYPSDLVLSDEKVAAIRENIAKQQAAQAQLGVLAGAAEAVGRVAPMAKVIADAQAQPAQEAAA